MEKDLLLQVKEKAQRWLDGNYDEKTKEQVKAMLANDDTTDLIESFYNLLDVLSRIIYDLG